MLFNLLRRIDWRISKIYRRSKLRNRTVSIISSNCNGGYIYHDLGLRFNSPTVNLYFEMSDFMKFLYNLDYYLSLDLTEDLTTKADFPVGKLGDIRLWFMHYKSFEEAQKKWNERKLRLDRNNLLIMATDRDGCTDQMVKEFDSLPFSNKIIFTHKEFPNLGSTFYMPEFKDKDEVGILSDFIPSWRIRRYLDRWNSVAAINNITVTNENR